MGGYGSGHRGERFNTLYIDDCDVLCVWDLQRERFLRAGEIQMGAMHLASGNSVFLDVDASDGNRGRLIVDGQSIRLSTSPGVVGGHRWWMHCPVDDRRVAMLYRPLSGPDFIGRAAGQLRYRSAYMGRHDQAVIRARKALRRLAGPEYCGPLTRDLAAIPKPHRQRWATCVRNQQRALAALLQLNEESKLALDRLVGKPLGSGLIRSAIQGWEWWSKCSPPEAGCRNE